jgi:hypothetical protein
VLPTGKHEKFWFHLFPFLYYFILTKSMKLSRKLHPHRYQSFSAANMLYCYHDNIHLWNAAIFQPLASFLYKTKNRRLQCHSFKNVQNTELKKVGYETKVKTIIKMGTTGYDRYHEMLTPGRWEFHSNAIQWNIQSKFLGPEHHTDKHFKCGKFIFTLLTSDQWNWVSNEEAWNQEY